MKWIKKGQVFTLSNSLEYKKTHASNPLAIHLEGDVFRVFIVLEMKRTNLQFLLLILM